MSEKFYMMFGNDVIEYEDYEAIEQQVMAISMGWTDH